VVRDVLAGADVGTLIGGADAGAGRALSGRQRWIAFFHKPQGDLALDAGAVSAVENQGRSLLPIGIRAVTGKFKTGAVVNLRGPDGRLVGRGMVSYGADELRRIMGRRSSEMAALLGGAADFEEAVHRDNLVLIGSPAD